MESVGLICRAAENVNLAYYQNAIPIIRELSIENRTGGDLRNVAVHLSSEPAFVTPCVWRIDRIADADVHHLRAVDIKLDQVVLSKLTASRRAEIFVRVVASESGLAEQTIEVNLLPPVHWGGSAAAPELLAAFVRPTDPSIDVILREAAEKLSQAGRNPAIDGYRARTKVRAWEIAEAIWVALVGHSIAYVLPPKSFERHGQMVRSPAEILSSSRHMPRPGASLRVLHGTGGPQPHDRAGRGPRLSGLLANDDSFSTAVVDDAQTMRKRVQLQEMVLVETTMLTGEQPARFKQAADAAARQISEDALKPLEFALDVRAARKAQIRPLDVGGSGGSVIEPRVAGSAPQALAAAPAFEEEQPAPIPKEARVFTRFESWKNSLLDLSLRNRLLNFKEGRSLPIECPDPAHLLDLLSGGRRMKTFLGAPRFSTEVTETGPNSFR